VSNHRALYFIIVPFFNEYPIYGAKGQDFKDFSAGLDIIHKKGHLTSEGLAQLPVLSNEFF